ncbi:hypothetical protein S40288_10911 [Stachybotrys chartarum IBT 40288]|nr:hypothetical protein S40288_10911 [Stachybotrys chartarum IBT 40288]
MDVSSQPYHDDATSKAENEGQEYEKPYVWIEDMSMDDLDEWHELRTDAEAAELCRETVSASLEESKVSLEYHIDEVTEGQWALKKTVFLKSKPGALAAAAAFIYTSGPSPYGLQLRFEVLRKYRHHGVAYEGLQMFLNEYWRRERFGPYDKMFRGVTEPPDDLGSTRRANSPTLRFADDPGVANTEDPKSAEKASSEPNRLASLYRWGLVDGFSMMRDDNDETGVSLQAPCSASQPTDASSTPISIHAPTMPMPAAGTQAASSTNQETDVPIDRPPAPATLYSFSSAMTELQLPLRVHPGDVDGFVLFDKGTAIDSDSATLSLSPRAKTPDDQQLYPAMEAIQMPTYLTLVWLGYLVDFKVLNGDTTNAQDGQVKVSILPCFIGQLPLASQNPTDIGCWPTFEVMPPYCSFEWRRRQPRISRADPRASAVRFGK